MKSSITIFLLLLVFVQSFVSIIYDIDFWINKDYIAANLCVNKNKPQMHCNGKCFLEKQKQNAEKQNEQPNNNKKEKFEVQPFFLPSSTVITFYSVSENIFYDHVNNFPSAGYAHKIFHPPAEQC